MGKLIKYEWKKQRGSRMIILVALAVAVLSFTWATFSGHNGVAGICMVLMFFAAFLVLLYTGIESIVVLNRDLRTKQSYMLWMVPRSIWEILGAKFLSAVIQMFFVFGLFFAAGCICFAIGAAESGGIRAIIEGIGRMAEDWGKIHISWGNLIMLGIIIFLHWIEIIFIGFLAVILSRTVLIRSRFAGLFAVILFFIIDYIIGLGEKLLFAIPGVEAASFPATLAGWNPWEYIYAVFAAFVLFGISGWIAERKLSV